MRILDITEPDWCNYHFKVSTRYMCTGVNQLPKASTREAQNGMAKFRLQRRDVSHDLDMSEEQVPIVERRVNCKVE